MDSWCAVEIVSLYGSGEVDPDGGKAVRLAANGLVVAGVVATGVRSATAGDSTIGESVGGSARLVDCIRILRRDDCTDVVDRLTLREDCVGSSTVDKTSGSLVWTTGGDCFTVTTP